MAEATKPTMDTTNGAARNTLRRWRMAASVPRASTGTAMQRYATTPDGASVVNSTSVISLKAVSNPVITSVL